jgi:YidC/Oxa1 family membrane protein insertase
MQPDNTRNTILFVVCAVAIFVFYDLFVLRPNEAKRQAEVRAAQSQAAAQAGSVGPTAPGAAPAIQALARPEALAQSPRVPVRNPFLQGSVALEGGRIDDLFLTRYRETMEERSPAVELFRPEGARASFFADFGWTGANVPGLPGPGTVWTLAEGGTLTPTSPITLRYDNGAGLVFTRRVAVDERYMFTVTDGVANRTGAPVTLAPYGAVQQQGVPPDFTNIQIVHEGAIGMLGGDLVEIKWPKWRKREEPLVETSTGGWVGITEKYWMAALIPDQSSKIEARFRNTEVGGVTVFDSTFTGEPRTLAPGTATTNTTRLFAGAKRVQILDAYSKDLNIPRLRWAVDWGFLWFLTQPIFAVLEFFHGLVGNFGVAILLLTVVIKALFYPLANKAFTSMSKLKKLQPQMEEIKKRYGKDPQKQQQETLALYQREKVNPVSGCLPILLQIPVFYALYKTLTVTLEMRHAPFFGWVNDLSARDPTTALNLFGLLPFDPADAPLIGGLLGGPLHIGVWPLLYGLSMWLTQSMQPMSADPIQKKIFQFFPVIFTFVMAPFAVGLVIYWTWQNALSILQQYVIMRRSGTDNPIDGMLARLRGRRAPAPGA